MTSTSMLPGPLASKINLKPFIGCDGVRTMKWGREVSLQGEPTAWCLMEALKR